MNYPHRVGSYALFVVRGALAKYRGCAPDAIRPRQHLLDDLEMDAFDLAIVAATLEEKLDIDLTGSGLDEDRSVLDFAFLVAKALDVRDASYRRSSA
jgi:hypothetical protein